MAFLAQKLCGEKKLSKSVFGYLKTNKKVPMAIKLEWGGGGKILMAWPFVEELFLRLPLNAVIKLSSDDWLRF